MHRTAPSAPVAPGAPGAPDTAGSYELQKRAAAERRKREKATRALSSRIAELEARIAERETAIKELEATMADPGFYGQPEAVKAAADRHQALMWEVGDLLSQWEMLQTASAEQPDLKS